MLFRSAVNTPDNQKKEAAPSASPEAKTPSKSTASNAKVDKSKAATPPPAKPVAKPIPIMDEKEATALLGKYTCTACHKARVKAVGPAYSEVAKRKYSVSKIVQLIYEPKPQNWPDFSTPMAPMPNVPKADAEKIATWINSLK